MIKRLRKKFIVITMLSVAAVMLLLSLTVNVANYISVDRELTQTLRMISENRGRIPSFPHGEKPVGTPGRPSAKTSRPSMARTAKARLRF